MLRRMIAAHVATGASATIAVEEVPADETYRYGIVAPAGNADPPAGDPFRLKDIIEKPHRGASPSRLAVVTWTSVSR